MLCKRCWIMDFDVPLFYVPLLYSEVLNFPAVKHQMQSGTLALAHKLSKFSFPLLINCKALWLIFYHQQSHPVGFFSGDGPHKARESFRCRSRKVLSKAIRIQYSSAWNPLSQHSAKHTVENKAVPIAQLLIDFARISVAATPPFHQC